MVWPIVSTMYQHAVCIGLRTIVFGPDPWIDRASLLYVQLLSPTRSTSRNQKIPFPGISRVIGLLICRVPVVSVCERSPVPGSAVSRAGEGSEGSGAEAESTGWCRCLLSQVAWKKFVPVDDLREGSLRPRRENTPLTNRRPNQSGECLHLGSSLDWNPSPRHLCRANRRTNRQSGLERVAKRRRPELSPCGRRPGPSCSHPSGKLEQRLQGKTPGPTRTP